MPACATHLHWCKRIHICLHKQWFLLSNAIQTSPLYSPAHADTHSHSVWVWTALATWHNSMAAPASPAEPSVLPPARHAAQRLIAFLCLLLYTSVHYCSAHLFMTKQFSNYNHAWIIAHCIARRSSNPAFHSLGVSHLFHQAVVDGSLHTATDQPV